MAEHVDWSEEARGFHFRTVYRQRWSDLDALGHVNHLAYLRWCEDIRCDHALAVGLSVPGSGSHSQVVVALEARYVEPLRRDEDVHIALKIERVGRTSLATRTAIGRERICFEARTTLVLCDDATMRPTPWPDELRGRLEGPV